MNGEYRVKNADLQELYREAGHLRKQFDRVTLTHVRRADNARADFLCNEALDGRPRKAGEAAVETAAPAKKPSAPAGEKRAVPSAALRDDAVAFLAAAAKAWAADGVAAMPAEMAWDRLWELLDEHGALKKRK